MFLIACGVLESFPKQQETLKKENTTKDAFGKVIDDHFLQVLRVE